MGAIQCVYEANCRVLWTPLSLCVRVIRILSTLHVCRDMSKETKARFRELTQFPVRVRVMSYFRRRSREHWENMLNPLNRFTDAGRARRQAGKPKTCREVYGIPGPTAHRPRRDRPAAAAAVGSRPKTRYLRCVRKREMTPMETEEKVLHNSMAVGSMGFK